MQILKYMLGVMLVLLVASPSFAYKTLDDLTLPGGGGLCFISGDENDSKEGNCLSETVKSLKPGMWGVPMLDGKDQLDLVGNTACVDYRGKQDSGEAADNQSYFDKPSDGGVCYCQMTGPETSSWMFEYEFKDYKGCNSECAVLCARDIMEDTYKIRTNMFKTVNYGGGSSGGDDYSWLYDTTGMAKYCLVDPKDGFTDEGCPSGTDKIITEPPQWAALLESKEHPGTIVTGTAWVSNKIDTKEPKLGYIPTDSNTIEDINKEYASYKSGDNPDGQYCYCKMETPGESSWVLLIFGEVVSLKNCMYKCADSTSKRGTGGTEATTLTDAMFSTLKSAAGGMSVVVTTQNYVDGLLNTKQARITTIGTNKLMTFGPGAGATPGSRNIVSTLSGASTSATSVPETGPIVAGINSKQNAVNGTANYVMTGTGTAGIMTSKPVYSATNNYSNALITAGTINTAAATAANGELYCARFVDGAPQTDANCLLWGMNTTAPAVLDASQAFGFAPPNYDFTINGTSYCYRASNLQGVDGTCNSDTISYLDESEPGSRTGKWGTVFSYGNVSGISVCSTIQQPINIVIATDEQSLTLDSEYANHPGNTGRSCWCKMENPAASRWVGINSTPENQVCDRGCADTCGFVMMNGSTSFRSAVLGGIM